MRLGGGGGGGEDESSLLVNGKLPLLIDENRWVYPTSVTLKYQE